MTKTAETAFETIRGRKYAVELSTCRMWGRAYAVQGLTAGQARNRLRLAGYGEITIARTLRAFDEQIANG